MGLRRARLARVLGVRVDDAEVERILRALGLGVEATADGWRVTAPTRRFDIAIEEDLIEEIARIHGYNAIPTTLPGGATQVVSPSETQLDEATVRGNCARAFLEAITTPRRRKAGEVAGTTAGAAGQSAQRRTEHDAHDAAAGWARAG